MIILLVIIAVFAVIIYFGHRIEKNEEAKKNARSERESKIRRDYATGRISEAEATMRMAEEWGINVIGGLERLQEGEAKQEALSKIEVDQASAVLIKELIAVGRSTRPGSGSTLYLSSSKARAREIGTMLNERAGLDLMLRAHQDAQRALGGASGRELEVAWNGIGEWLG